MSPPDKAVSKGDGFMADNGLGDLGETNGQRRREPGGKLNPREEREKLVMKKIEAIIKPYVLEDVKSGLQEIGLMGMTVSEVRGYTGHRAKSKLDGKYPVNGNGGGNGAQASPAFATVHGMEAYDVPGALPYGFSTLDDFVPSLKLELVVHDQMVNDAVNVILGAGQLRSFSAGELLIHNLVDVIRIRTEEHLEQAI